MFSIFHDIFIIIYPVTVFTTRVPLNNLIDKQPVSRNNKLWCSGLDIVVPRIEHCVQKWPIKRGRKRNLSQ